MSFEMEKDGHQIEMIQDRLYGLEILDLKCPHKSKLEAIKKWQNRWGLNLSDRQYEELGEILDVQSSCQTVRKQE